jgi:hypothetical protein
MKMSIFVQRYLWPIEIPPNDKYVAIALADYANDDGTNAYPSQSTLVKKTGLSIQTVRRSLHRLRKMEIIVLSRAANQRQSRCYVFKLPPGFTTFRDIPQVPLGALRGTSEALRGTTQVPSEVPQGYPIHKESSIDTHDNSDLSASVPMPKGFRETLGLQRAL